MTILCSLENGKNNITQLDIYCVLFAVCMYSINLVSTPTKQAFKLLSSFFDCSLITMGTAVVNLWVGGISSSLGVFFKFKNKMDFLDCLSSVAAPLPGKLSRATKHECKCLKPSAWHSVFNTSLYNITLSCIYFIPSSSSASSGSSSTTSSPSSSPPASQREQGKW